MSLYAVKYAGNDDLADVLAKRKAPKERIVSANSHNEAADLLCLCEFSIHIIETTLILRGVAK